MINLGTRGNELGFYIRVEANIRFIPMGNIDKMNEPKMKRLLNKARRLEMHLMRVDEKAPRTISDLLRGGKIKHVQISNGIAKLAMPNCNSRATKLHSSTVDVEAQCMAMRICNHYGFDLDGATFFVAKSLIKTQMYAAL